jgi:hypothetical protein
MITLCIHLKFCEMQKYGLFSDYFFPYTRVGIVRIPKLKVQLYFTNKVLSYLIIAYASIIHGLSPVFRMLQQ